MVSWLGKLLSAHDIKVIYDLANASAKLFATVASRCGYA